MLRLTVVDLSAESRSNIARALSELQESDSPESAILPRISIQQLTVEELKFHSAPDICVIGNEIIEKDLNLISKIKKLLPDTPLIARISLERDRLPLIEDLARMGIDDTILDQTDSQSFYKKIILLCRRPKKDKTGHLILVDSAKGGLGVTSIVAGLAEAGVDSGKRVAVLDFDCETQDLSRFLQSRPFVNENLEVLLQGSRPITTETVLQCLSPVWSEEAEAGLYCMSPASLTYEQIESITNSARTFLSILEIIDSNFDLVLVDMGSVKGSLLRTLYRVCDKVVTIVSNDPACLYATVSKVGTSRSLMSATTEQFFLENSPTRHGLPREILIREINLAAKCTEENWISLAIPFCRKACRWPGSGDTIFSRSSGKLHRAIKKTATFLGIDDTAMEPSFSRSDLSDALKYLSEVVRNKIAPRRLSDDLNSELKNKKLLSFNFRPETFKLNQEKKVENKSPKEVFEKLAKGTEYQKNAKETDVSSTSEESVGQLFKKANVS